MFAEIEIKGQKIGLYFGLPALAAVSHDMEILEGNEVLVSMGMIVSVLNAGHENWAMIKRQRVTLKYEDFYDYVEKSMMKGDIPDELKGVMTDFGKSKLTGLVENGEEKKN
jgi:hypothetical protein